MPANKYGIDLGEIYKTKEAIKGARLQNQLAEMQIGQAKSDKQKQGVISELRQKASEGDQDSVKRLIALDPQGGKAFIDAVSKMDDSARKQAQQNVDMIGRMSATVLNAKPERQEELYQGMLQQLPPETRKKMPVNFDPNYLELSISKASEMDKILENPKLIEIGGEDVVYQRGREIERAKQPVESTELKSADESLMYRQAAELLGGLFDEQGNLQALDPELRSKAQGIANEATKIFRSGGVTRTEAVSKAAKKFGINIGQGNQENDPLGIR